jgi:hypothetical protein
MNAVVIHVPQDYSREDTRDWTNRSEVRSTSSNRFYIWPPLPVRNTPSVD